jgi:hypothetical protein
VTDQLEELFSTARASALAEVRPPGVAAARRTVRRRRTTTSVAAAVALVSIVSAVVAINRQQDDSLQLARPSAPVGDLSAWTADAKQAAGVNPAEGPSGVAPLMGDTTYFLDTVGGGTFTVTVACAGEGTTTVLFDLGKTIGAAVDTPCGSPARVTRKTLTVPESVRYVQVDAIPDSAATGRAAVAVQMKLANDDRLRLEDQVRAALPGQAGTLSTASMLNGDYGVRDGTIRPGRYRVSFNCLGVGTVTLAVALTADENAEPGPPVSKTALDCGPTPKSSSVTVVVPPRGAKAIDLTLRPDDSATGRSCAGIRVERL